MNPAQEKAVEVLKTIKEYPSGYRSYADAPNHVRPLTKLEDQLIDVIQELLREPEEGWEFRAAEVSGDRIETWGPKGDPNVSWKTLEEAIAGATEDDAFVVRRRKAGVWERVH